MTKVTLFYPGAIEIIPYNTYDEEVFSVGSFEAMKELALQHLQKQVEYIGKLHYKDWKKKHDQ
jgi:hypothetical protein